jgi:hypothetical protein
MKETLALAALGGHLAIILFNLFGLFAVPVGAVCGWRFVRRRWWRVLHVASLGLVALQAAFGRACILTLWQARLGRARMPAPLIRRWVEGIIYWRLPLWVFAALYVLVFGYALVLFWLVPPRASNTAIGLNGSRAGARAPRS